MLPLERNEEVNRLVRRGVNQPTRRGSQSQAGLRCSGQVSLEIRLYILIPRFTNRKPRVNLRNTLYLKRSSMCELTFTMCLKGRHLTLSNTR